MINGIPESSKFDDVKIPEVGRQIEQTDQRPVPSLKDLKNKLEDIFKVETLDDASTKENITETNPLDESNLCSVTLDDGTVVTVPDVKSYEIVTKTDDNGTVYLKNGELEPNTTYELNGNTYTTDEQGRIIRCEARPERSPENPRDVNAQIQAGGEDRRPSDQGGHIVGRDLNGDGGAGNLVAMDSRINLYLIPAPYDQRVSHTEPFLVIVIRCSTSSSGSGRGPYATLPEVSWSFSI